MKAAIILSLVIASPLCFAQETYKCRTAVGTVYQDRPCAAAANTVGVYGVQTEPVSAGKPAQAAVSPSATDREKAFFAGRAKDRKRAEITSEEQEIAELQRAMDAELNALREKKAQALPNLAGATWEQSISGEMQAVTARYGQEIAVKQDKIRRLREDLAKM